MPATLLYHDVVPRGQEDTSGFPGAGAARYKLTPDAFDAHLDALARVVQTPPGINPARPADPTDSTGWMLAFDDGGRSALTPIADLLERRGWRGLFFVPTDYIGRPAFLSRDGVRELRARGHAIGTHTCSHPVWMSACPWHQLLDEWARSRDLLSDLLGEPVTTASVPGGFYSTHVARAAARAGIRVLFNSEPTTRPRVVDDCLVLGRFSVVRHTPPAAAAGLLAGRRGYRSRQAIAWSVRKTAKALFGTSYLTVRDRFLARHRSAATGR